MTGTFYAVATLVVILLGLSKGGFAGIGTLGTPLLALVIGPVDAAAVILPILLVQDAVGVWAFRHSWNRQVLAVMLPGAMLGILLAFLLAARVPERAMASVLGAISVLFAIRSLWLLRGGTVPAPVHPPHWFGALMGVASGFTSQVAHAGQPPFQIYVLPRRLPRDELVGTTAIFFAAVNWIKVPAYLALGQFTRAHLLASATMLPVALASTFAGVWLVRRVDADRFYLAVYLLLLLVGGKLLYDGLF